MKDSLPTGFGTHHLDDLRSVVSQSSTPQQIFDHILSAVSVGALPSGTALPPERTLAEALEVSRTSVRVALDRLERAGIVTRRRGRGGGTFIAEVSADTLGTHRKRAADFRGTQLHALEARAVLHGRIASLAAARASSPKPKRSRIFNAPKLKVCASSGSSRVRIVLKTKLYTIPS